MISIRKALDKALSHYEKKEYDEAERVADALTEAYPEFSRAIFLKAVILEETGRKEEAEKYYARCDRLHSLWYRLALQLQESDPERALKYYDKVSTLDPQNNMIWYGMGGLYERLGKFEEARKCFQKISLQRDVIARVVSPIGFLIIMVTGSIMMLKRGDSLFASLVILSAIICLFWLKRDGGQVLQMMIKKRKYR
jgi:thioredoxin-like negative regulator of GroEL